MLALTLRSFWLGRKCCIWRVRPKLPVRCRVFPNGISGEIPRLSGLQRKRSRRPIRKFQWSHPIKNPIASANTIRRTRGWFCITFLGSPRVLFLARFVLKLSKWPRYFTSIARQPAAAAKGPPSQQDVTIGHILSMKFRGTTVAGRFCRAYIFWKLQCSQLNPGTSGQPKLPVLSGCPD